MTTKITAANLDEIRESVSTVDQRNVLCVGAQTWGIWDEVGQRGQITVLPDGRAAICHGADSEWGEWDARTQRLTTDEGYVYDSDGICLEEPS